MPRPRRPPPAPKNAPTALSPLRILTQIVTLQLLYYLCATGLLLFTALTAGRPFSPDLVLSWRSLRGDTAVGWSLGVCWLGASFCGYVFFFFSFVCVRVCVCVFYYCPLCLSLSTISPQGKKGISRACCLRLQAKQSVSEIPE